MALADSEDLMLDTVGHAGRIFGEAIGKWRPTPHESLVSFVSRLNTRGVSNRVAGGAGNTDKSVFCQMTLKSDLVHWTPIEIVSG